MSDRDGAVIELHGAHKSYRTGPVEVIALRPVDLAIGAGEFVCVAGPSGSGKTTLLNLMGAIDRPSGGSVFLAGEAVSGLSRAERAGLRLRTIGFVFQSYNLIPVLSAKENVEYVLLLRGMPAPARRARVDEVLAAVGILPEGDRRPGELSGGQQQRVAVARAIAGRPAIVIADEPTANLDSRTAEELMALLVGLNREGTTFVFSSHDPRVVEKAGRVLRLRDGTIEEDRRSD